MSLWFIFDRLRQTGKIYQLWKVDNDREYIKSN